jgi:hypothetical protein
VLEPYAKAHQKAERAVEQPIEQSGFLEWYCLAAHRKTSFAP